MEMEKRFNGKIYKFWMRYQKKDDAEREINRLREGGTPARLAYDKHGYKESCWSIDYRPWLVYTYGEVKI